MRIKMISSSCKRTTRKCKKWPSKRCDATTSKSWKCSDAWS